MRGGFVTEDGGAWYRIEDPDHQPPFFMVLAGDSDLCAFIPTAGSLAAGRGDLLQQQSDGTVRFAPALANRADL